MLDPFWALGFNRFENESFPPYNIVKDEEDFFVEVALAGYNPVDIKVELDNNTLSIESEKNPREEQFLYKKIANRAFSLKFELAPHMEVKEVTSRHGILTVHVHKNIPPELLPKKYEVKMLEAIEK
jgi:molecular chaperone IbpA